MNENNIGKASEVIVGKTSGKTSELASTGKASPVAEECECIEISLTKVTLTLTTTALVKNHEADILIRAAKIMQDMAESEAS